ncbi:MAG: PhoH family protein [Pseudomonadota bacterium]
MPRDAAPEALDETVVAFADNRLLIELFGPADSNLTILENGLGATIMRRGNQLLIYGPPDARTMAKGALEALYERLETGRSIEAGDVEALIRMGRLPEPNPETDPRAETRRERGERGDPEPPAQSELFPGGRLEIRTRRKVIQPRTPTQAAYVRALFSHELVFGIGPAGTGKTYLAVAAAVSLFAEQRVEKIILSRPAVEAGERLGFLPGTEKEKMDPYMRPLYDALQDMLPRGQLDKLMGLGQIEIAPLAFMRGRTLSNAAVVLDEAQNTTEMQMKMFLTRLGENSCMVVTGDPTQIDLPRGTGSGLVQAMRVLQGVEGIAFTRFSSTDVVRHPVVARVIEAYDRADAPRPPARS